MNYRPELDGLRALAVISIILYHVQFPIFNLSGGFIGVDVFFVLSGYFITRILLISFYNTGHIEIRSFLERRARRILPLLILIMIISLPFA